MSRQVGGTTVTKRWIAGLSAIASIVTMGAVTATSSTAEAAPRPSAKVCVINQEGGAYRGPIVLHATTGGLFNGPRPVFTHNADSAGCTTFAGLKPGTSYWVSGSVTLQKCQDHLKGDGTWGKYGVEQVRGFSSGVRRAPSSGVLQFPRQVAAVQTTSCF